MSILVLVAPTCFVSTAFAGDLGRDRSPEQNFGRFHRGAEASQEPGVFHRGVAIHDAMNWATMDAQKKHYVFPPFSDAQHPLTPDELAVIRRAGFDFVRLTIDPGPFLQFQGAQLDTTYDILRRRAQMILDAGLGVIVDFHPVTQDADYGPKAIVAGIDTPLFNAYCDMLARTAGVLDGLHTNRVALELMNEPDATFDAGGETLWQAEEEKAYARARAASPNLLIVLTGVGGDANGLIALDPRPFAADAAIIFTFHYYDPTEFVFQSLPSDPSYRFAADIPYPAQARALGDSVKAITARVDKLDPSLASKAGDIVKGVADALRYRESNFNRSNIHETFNRVAVWAETRHIAPTRIFLGEFNALRRYGRYDGARDSERAQWLRDVREEAELHEYPWSIWAYRGYGGMAIVKTDGAIEIDEPTLNALGLRQMGDHP